MKSFCFFPTKPPPAPPPQKKKKKKTKAKKRSSPVQGSIITDKPREVWTSRLAWREFAWLEKTLFVKNNREDVVVFLLFFFVFANDWAKQKQHLGDIFVGILLVFAKRCFVSFCLAFWVFTWVPPRGFDPWPGFFSCFCLAFFGDLLQALPVFGSRSLTPSHISHAFTLPEKNKHFNKINKNPSQILPWQ